MTVAMLAQIATEIIAFAVELCVRASAAIRAITASASAMISRDDLARGLHVVDRAGALAHGEGGAFARLRPSIWPPMPPMTPAWRRQHRLLRERLDVLRPASPNRRPTRS